MLRSIPGVLTVLLCTTALQAQVTPICQLQGPSAGSPFAGQVVTTTGIITAIHLGTGSLGGYFIEEPGCDADPATSNGIFVYHPSATGLTVGQRVQVTATTVEYQGLTELTSVSSAQVTGSGTVTPTDVQLPITDLTRYEELEGMLVRFPGDLVVNDASDWAQYGELILAPARLYTPTDHVDPNDVVASGTSTTGTSNAAAVNAAADLNATSRVLLDDGRTSSYPSPPPLIGPDGTVRAGSTITDLTAVLSYGYSAYRLQPAGSIPIVHAARPAVPTVGGQVRVGSLNVLNYWTSLGQWGAANSNELARQRTKLVAALSAMDCDVLVLHELEANSAAPTDLLNALNDAVVVPYVMINDGVTGNATKSVLFHRPSTVTPCTPLYTLNLSVFQRPHHTQGYQVNATGGRFLVSAMHLRSKICGGGGTDDQDLGDGQGCYNGTRRDQATALLASWSDIRQVTGIDAQLAIGDMNAYTEEDPADVLRTGGFLDLLPAGSYSYFYAGSVGALDHAFGTASLNTALTGAGCWSINSDEPPSLGYADANLALYQPNAFRSSDHDPVLVGLDALQLPVGLTTTDQRSSGRVSVDETSITWTFPPTHQPGSLILSDALGRTIHAASVVGPSYRMDRSGLAGGVYRWRSDRGKAVQGGTIVLP